METVSAQHRPAQGPSSGSFAGRSNAAAERLDIGPDEAGLNELGVDQANVAGVEIHGRDITAPPFPSLGAW